mmetsp:Transcript_22197/g.34361  ORF Transcript_22197/g.34361 Transcript_22197/m.34361 type:complete len:260 (+) Transcript_22197:1579-2358(+)|eukprot:CAMPEP_0170498448 /NCGR_PEP_ID=MMETSP0208-20121228/27840_1 /TAXON_ID=197538 /ORGANISM="Strombidium inclinatum, Strain S3" /LENGTH=259 /DNA_ID=CAMNT_0010775621 /DNA_START=1516 /DNA_END=2295 /DNA_ORIENTATION=-
MVKQPQVKQPSNSEVNSPLIPNRSLESCSKKEEQFELEQPLEPWFIDEFRALRAEKHDCLFEPAVIRGKQMMKRLVKTMESHKAHEPLLCKAILLLYDELFPHFRLFQIVDELFWEFDPAKHLDHGLPSRVSLMKVKALALLEVGKVKEAEAVFKAVGDSSFRDYAFWFKFDRKPTNRPKVTCHEESISQIIHSFLSDKVEFKWINWERRLVAKERLPFDEPILLQRIPSSKIIPTDKQIPNEWGFDNKEFVLYHEVMS